MSDKNKAISTVRMIVNALNRGESVMFSSENTDLFQNILDELKKPPEGLIPYGQKVYFGSNEVFRMKKVYEVVADRLVANGLLEIKKEELPDKRTVCEWRIKAVKWNE